MIAIRLAIAKDCQFLKKRNCQNLFKIFQCYTINPKRDLRKVIQWKMLEHKWQSRLILSRIRMMQKTLFKNIKMCIFLLDFWLYQARKMSKPIRGHSQISKKYSILLYLFPFHNTFNSSQTQKSHKIYNFFFKLSRLIAALS